MAAQKSASGTHSGRFRDDSNISIIKTESGTSIYRIHNSGDQSFTVSVPGSPPISELVSPDCSVDILLDGAKTLTIQPATATTAEGSYDLIDSGTARRGGRFRSESLATLPLIIKVPGLYRFINGGIDPTNPLTVGGLPIAKDCSIDLFVDGSATLSVNGVVQYQGGYDFLLNGAEVRSGRFKFTAVDSGGGVPASKTLIDVSSAPGAKTYRYRIINGGKKNIVVRKFSGGSWNNHANLKRYQSFDFQMSSGGISKIAVTASAVDNLIVGTIDYLDVLG